MEFLKIIVLTNEGKQEQLNLPIDLVKQLNKEVDNYPDGVPVRLESGRTVNAIVFLVPTKAFYKTNRIFIGKQEDTQ